MRSRFPSGWLRAFHPVSCIRRFISPEPRAGAKKTATLVWRTSSFPSLSLFLSLRPRKSNCKTQRVVEGRPQQVRKGLTIQWWRKVNKTKPPTSFGARRGLVVAISRATVFSFAKHAQFVPLRWPVAMGKKGQFFCLFYFKGDPVPKKRKTRAPLGHWVQLRKFESSSF